MKLETVRLSMMRKVEYKFGILHARVFSFGIGLGAFDSETN